VLRNLCLEARSIHSQAIEDAQRKGIALPKQAKEQVLCADVLLSAPDRLFLPQEDDAPRAFRKAVPHQ